MMRSIARILATLAALAIAPASAAPMNPDPTGMWYDPDQPGWGMSITQQGDAIFVALFVYDANHGPRWFVASDIVDTGAYRSSLVGEIYSGTLYRTTGPAFSAPSDTTAFRATPVGDIQIGYVQPTGNLAVTYTIDGTTVDKVVASQTWGSNARSLTGPYGARFIGGIFIDSTASCPLPPLLQNIPDFNIEATAFQDAVTLLWTPGNNMECTMNGTYAQRGQLGTLSGPVSCGPMIVGATPTPMGTLSIVQMAMGPGGFSGFLSYDSPVVNGSGCGVGGWIGGAQDGASVPETTLSPDPTGMWFDSEHPGWGIHVTQQGGTIFAVIFVYDESNQPRWYVASRVVDAGRPWNASDGFSGSAGELFSGTLYQTTGAFYGDDSDLSTLHSNAVGQLSMAYTSDSPRTLSIRYNVGNAVVVRKVGAQTWMSNAAQLSGTYRGGISIHPCSCFPEMCESPISGAFSMDLTATPGSSPSTLELAWNPGFGACKYTATYSQDGQVGAMQGSVACDGNPEALPFTVTNLAIGANGFSGIANLPGYCPGSIAGVKVQ